MSNRSTVLRLERRIQTEHQDALVVAEGAYGTLAEALLHAAHGRGYLGNEPLGALSHVLCPRLEDHQLSRAVYELWTIFFESFRQDEAAFEAKKFHERAAALNARVQELDTREDLAPAFTCELLHTLTEFWPERQGALSERIDMLIANLNEEQQGRGSADLQQAHVSDELSGTRAIVHASLLALGVSAEQYQDLPLHKTLELLLQQYRALLARLRDQMKGDKAQRQALHDGLHAAAAGTWATTAEQNTALAPEDRRIVESFVGLLQDNQQIEEDFALMRADSVQLQAELSHAQRGILERDKRIIHYEFSAPDGDEDQRLFLYRQIVAAYESGKDASALIEQVGTLERVLILDERTQASLRKVLDRQLESLTQELADFRGIIVLTEDPKRYRPRLLGASPYKLKTLAGTLQAVRDASRDVLVYVNKACWSGNLKKLGKEFKSLQRVFKEMVKLVADVRKKNGEAPPLSATVCIEANSGVAALPALLAQDIAHILSSKKAIKYAKELHEILEAVVSAYHKSLEKSIGDSIARPQRKGRESAIAAMRRLNEELLSLSVTMELHFSDAVQTAYELPVAESALQASLGELALSVRTVDTIYEIVSDIEGTPVSQLSKMPRGTAKDAERLRDLLGERVTWLEDVARYRIETPLV